MTDQTSAAPETHDHDAEPSARELDEQERARARMVNERAWSAIASPAAQTALVNVIAALGPIAEDREACARVLNAAAELFVPHAIAPRKEFDEILGEIIASPVGEAGMSLLGQYLAAQAQPKKAPCNCGPGIQAQRVDRPARPAIVTPVPARIPLFFVIRIGDTPDADLFLGSDGTTWHRRGDSAGPPEGAFMWTEARVLELVKSYPDAKVAAAN